MATRDTHKAQRTRLGDERKGPEPHEGDVLGISDAPPNRGEPHSTPGGGRRPSGIEARVRATGIGDVPQRHGASGIDMGGAGEGTDVKHESHRERAKTDRT
jgi:hypothetical protein